MMKKQHSGKRLRLLLKHLKTNHKITRKKFAEECEVHTVTINMWYSMDEFGDTVWGKIKPVLDKFNINADYLKGTSEIISTKAALDPNMEDVQFRKELLTTLKEIKDLLKSKPL